MNLPLYLQVEITSRCNLKCKMCPLTLGNTQTSGTDGNLEEASWEQVKRYAIQVGHVLISGFGEPITDRRFLPMLEELDALGVATGFSTNGIGAEHIAPRVARLQHLRSVNVSIDSPDPDVYRDIRGGELDRVFTGLRALVAAVGPKVSVSSVAMWSNLDSLLQFPAILDEFNVRLYTLQPLVEWSPDLRNQHIHAHRWTTDPIEQIKSQCAAFGITCLVTPQSELELADPAAALVQFHSRDLRETKPCIIPFESLYVDSAGSVFPCCHSAGSNAVLGSVRNEPLADIMNGTSMRRFQDDLLDAATTPAVCRACNIVPQGPHPFKTYRAAVEEITSNSDRYRLKVKNLGTVPWDADREIRVSATQPRDRVSALHHPSWINGGRVARANEPIILPGETATFDFTINPTGKPEWFQLLVEYHVWLPDTFFQLS